MKIKSIIAALFFCFGGAVAWAGSIDGLAFTELRGAKREESQAVNFAAWHGKPLLVAFWSSDCAPCLREMVILPDIAKDNKDLAIALISLKDAEHTKAHLTPMPDNVHVVVAEGDARETLKAFGNDRTLALPYSVMLGADGKVCGKYYGILAPDKIKEWRKQC